MLETIAGIVLITSFSGMALIILRKIPTLAGLPLSESKNVCSFSPLLKLKEQFFNSFSLLSILEKTLRTIKILTLRIENKIADWLKNLRQRSQSQKNISNEDYWEELKKIPKR